MSMIIDGTNGCTFPDTTVQTTTGKTGFVNRIINGAMVIDQRNAGAAVTPVTATYTLDRWQAYQSVASKFSVQQNAGAVTLPVGFNNYLGATSLSAYSVLAANFYLLRQNIEGFNFSDLAWGTANASTVTLSFRVYSSLTGTFGGSLQNSAQDRSYPFTYSIPVANTWTTISVTIAGDTTGTWVGATNGIGVCVTFGLGVGTAYSGTAGAWAGAPYFSATGATSVVGTNGATFYITGVQLEKGSTATSFDYRPYGTEFQLCQRYYVTGTAFGGQISVAGGAVFSPINMRTGPSTTISTTAFLENIGNITIAAVNTNQTTSSIFRQQYSNANAGSGTAPVSATFTASAEL
jgi:hypothetical protein